MSVWETIVYEKAGGIAHIVLNRPRVLNAYNLQMRDDFWEALEAARDDPEVGVVVLRGAGERAFCVGADLTEFGTAPSRVIAREVRWERDVWGLLLSIPKPFIAAVHGYVLGSGVEIALLCDLRIASQDAVFGLPEVSLGMIPAAGGSQTLPRMAGPGRALEMLLTGERIDANKAWEIGLVNRVVPRERLLQEVESLARQLLSWPQEAIRLAKEAVSRGLNLPLEEALALERRLALTLL